MVLEREREIDRHREALIGPDVMAIAHGPRIAIKIGGHAYVHPSVKRRRTREEEQETHSGEEVSTTVLLADVSFATSLPTRHLPIWPLLSHFLNGPR